MMQHSKCLVTCIMVLYFAPTYLDIVQHDRLHFSFYASFGATIIGVGAGKSLGVRGIFPQFPQNCPKNPKKRPPKKRLHFTGRKALQGQFLPKFHPSFPKSLLTCSKTTKLKHDFPQKKVNASTFILAAIFEK